MDITIDFYFDFISPFSYLAYQRLPSLAALYRHEVRCQVINLATVKLLAGNTGPSSRDQPLKRRYNQADKTRWADHYGVPIKNPRSYNPDRVNRGFFFTLDRGQPHDYLTHAWRRIWGEGGDMSSEGLLAEVAQQCGWDAPEFLAFTLSPDSEQRYHAASLAAHHRGVFGVPTMMIGEEMWWGNDRLDFLAAILAAR